MTVLFQAKQAAPSRSVSSNKNNSEPAAATRPADHDLLPKADIDQDGKIIAAELKYYCWQAKNSEPQCESYALDKDNRADMSRFIRSTLIELAQAGLIEQAETLAGSSQMLPWDAVEVYDCVIDQALQQRDRTNANAIIRQAVSDSFWTSETEEFEYKAVKSLLSKDYIKEAQSLTQLISSKYYLALAKADTALAMARPYLVCDESLPELFIPEEAKHELDAATGLAHDAYNPFERKDESALQSVKALAHIVWVMDQLAYDDLATAQIKEMSVITAHKIDDKKLRQEAIELAGSGCKIR